MLSEAELTEEIIKWVRVHAQRGIPNTIEITADTDLLSTGILDSMGFVELIMFIIGLGCSVDLADVDPSVFSVVSGLCKIALKGSA